MLDPDDIMQQKQWRIMERKRTINRRKIKKENDEHTDHFKTQQICDSVNRKSTDQTQNQLTKSYITKYKTNKIHTPDIT